MQNFVQKFIGGFLGLMASYHIIVTIFGYGILGGDSQVLISIGRDILWLLFIVLIFFGHISHIKEYLKKWKNVWIWFIILILFSIGVSILNGQSISNMMIGFKYGFFYLLIFLTASFVGFVSIKKIKTEQIYRFQYFLISIVILGFLWQIMKIARPDFFMNIGYGKFDDFYFGSNPPIYYLTGFEGITRWQGLFSGPNNYGYFLIAFLPGILLWRGNGFKKLKNIFVNPFQNISLFLIALRILAIIMTLSRAAIIGMILAFILLAKNWIRKNIKISLLIFSLIIGGIILLSIIKSSSTLGHLQAKLGYINEIIAHPLGHGLGTSGPAVHHKGTMLPENYFMQIMLDIGTVGFILWTAVIFQILLIFKNIEDYIKKSKLDTEKELAYLHWNGLYIGLIILFVIGLFLHVFEDSMVNYLFFISFGLISGYISKMYNIKNIKIKDLFISRPFKNL